MYQLIIAVLGLLRTAVFVLESIAMAVGMVRNVRGRKWSAA